MTDQTNDVWIHTQNKIKFNPFNPDPDNILIDDIAHALAHTCRYTGHVDSFYSVAEHSILVAQGIQQYGDDLSPSTRNEITFQALLHDASEAYLPDVASPVKDHLDGFNELEEDVLRAVMNRFQTDYPLHPMIKTMDTRILLDEIKQVRSDLDTKEWSAIEGQPLEVHIEPMDPPEAKERFLTMAREYAEITNRESILSSNNGESNPGNNKRLD